MENQNEKLGQEPAFPLPSGVEVNYNENGVIVDTANGMTKRFYAACMAMQGLCSSSQIRPGTFDFEARGKETIRHLTKIAYNIADELLKQENK